MARGPRTPKGETIARWRPSDAFQAEHARIFGAEAEPPAPSEPPAPVLLECARCGHEWEGRPGSLCPRKVEGSHG